MAMALTQENSKQQRWSLQKPQEYCGIFPGWFRKDENSGFGIYTAK
jgi:hypothetical protein